MIKNQMTNIGSDVDNLRAGPIFIINRNCFSNTTNPRLCICKPTRKKNK